VQVAQVIRRFRDLGMPLDQIRQVLQASDVAVRNQVIAAHLQRMEAQLALTQSVVASLRSLLDGALGLYVTRRGIGAAGPIREQYVVTQFDTDDESGLRTEVCWPVHASGQPRHAAGGTRTPDARQRAAGT
jgi:DNA-binding transcriptional MerR regulator